MLREGLEAHATRNTNGEWKRMKRPSLTQIFLPSAIVLFWLVMIFTLVTDRIIPERIRARTALIDAECRPPAAQGDVYRATLERPFCIGVYELAEEAIEQGRREYREYLAAYKLATETGEWPGYPAEVAQLSLPKWAQKNEEVPF